jgi:hypothetical protein
MINTVVRNLIWNAIKFTNPGGKIILNIEARAGLAEFSITDNGLVFPLNKLKIFLTSQVSLPGKVQPRKKVQAWDLSFAKNLLRKTEVRFGL